MNIFEALRADHDNQRALIEALVDTVGADGDRLAIFQELEEKLNQHAMSEERHFYVPLMQADLTQEKARHSVAEHKDLDDLVARLRDYDASAPQWLQTAQELRHQLLHHLEEEEHEVFQLAGKVLTDAQKCDLATAYVAEMDVSVVDKSSV